MLSVFFATNKDAHILCASDGAGLVDANLDPGHVEFRENGFGYFLGHGFNQLKFGLTDKLLHALGNFFVVKGILNIVTGGRLADICTQLKINADGLANLALPLPDTDNRFDPEVGQKNSISVSFVAGSERSLVASGSNRRT